MPRIKAMPQTEKARKDDVRSFVKLQDKRGAYRLTAQDALQGFKSLGGTPEIGKRTKHPGTKARPTKSQ
jgi:hypothetical protein